MGNVDVPPPVNVKVWFGVIAVQIKSVLASADTLAGMVLTVIVIVEDEPTHEPVVDVGVIM